MSLANDYDNRQQQTIIRGDNFTFPVKMSMFGILPNSPYVKLKCLLIIDKEIIHGSHILYQVLIWVTLFSRILHTERKRVIKYNENTQDPHMVPHVVVPPTNLFSFIFLFLIYFAWKIYGNTDKQVF